MIPEAPVETFPALSELGIVRHGFTGRVPGLDTKVDRPLALRRLDDIHRAARERMGMGDLLYVSGEQVHGNGVAVVDSDSVPPVPAVDGLITVDPGVCLGIYVADCCAVYLVDTVRKVIGLLHSGRKGTDLGITPVAIRTMHEHFGTNPGDVVVQLSPCIRPPLYEVDFAAEIRRQCREAGVQEVYDPGTCTGSNLDRYYSYRVEKGKTGRMLALLALSE